MELVVPDAEIVEEVEVDRSQREIVRHGEVHRIAEEVIVEGPVETGVEVVARPPAEPVGFDRLRTGQAVAASGPGASRQADHALGHVLQREGHVDREADLVIGDAHPVVLEMPDGHVVADPVSEKSAIGAVRQKSGQVHLQLGGVHQALSILEEDLEVAHRLAVDRKHEIVQTVVVFESVLALDEERREEVVVIHGLVGACYDYLGNVCECIQHRRHSRDPCRPVGFADAAAVRSAAIYVWNLIGIREDIILDTLRDSLVGRPGCSGFLLDIRHEGWMRIGDGLPAIRLTQHILIHVVIQCTINFPRLLDIGSGRLVLIGLSRRFRLPCTAAGYLVRRCRCDSGVRHGYRVCPEQMNRDERKETDKHRDEKRQRKHPCKIRRTPFHVPL